MIVAVCVAAVGARADSLELKNGSLINGKFMGGTQTSISFQVGLSVQSYGVADIRSLRFDSDAQGTSPSVSSKQPSAPSAIGQDEVAKSVPSVNIPAGTCGLVYAGHFSIFVFCSPRENGECSDCSPWFQPVIGAS